MLKWTVNKRGGSTCGDQSSRRPSLPANCTYNEPKSEKVKRRRRSSIVRRSGPTRRSLRDSSLCLDFEKENRFTSTPIKTSDELQEVLRDVSNVPEKLTRRSLSEKKSKFEPKKKKQCLDPEHGNYFRNFESVDSHIGSLHVPTDFERLREAPTLPAYNLNFLKITPKSCRNFKDENKQAKIDHVNDFLQQISIITSPEGGYGHLNNHKNLNQEKNEIISPLVKKLVGLNFAYQKEALEQSSLINDLSLDKLVDAILEKSVRDNEINESQEENMINMENERQSSNSTDSGFKSSSNEINHDLGDDFTCKCGSNQTIINLDTTYNERCVDVTTNPKKRLSSPLIEDSYTLKRQKCIRRKKVDDHKVLDDNSNDTDDNMSSGSSNNGDNEKNDNRLNDETYVIGSGLKDQIFSRRCLTFNEDNDDDCSNTRGNIDLKIRYEKDEIIINVYRCSDLQRSNGQAVNAYVKVALGDRYTKGRRKRKDTLQRTAVQAECTNPIFNHVFRVPLQRSDFTKILYVEVWHRERSTRRSEFLGCTSFVIKNAIKKDISGVYQLLPQSLDARRKTPPITAPESGADSVSEMGESRASVDELTAFDELEDELKKPTSKAVLTQHQKDADENLFLRYLELDPTEGPDAAPAAAQRRAAGTKSSGRTPFTTTKVLRRAPKSGFGFSVVWTHPPRIERVEKGLPADKAGIAPGDYLIFVDKHNVVMMPEIEILELIRSLGGTLTLEIFRRSTSRNGSVPSVRQLNFETGSMVALPPPPPLAAASSLRRPSTVCSTNTTSVEYNRKKLHLPQVTFSSERPTNSPEEARRKAMYQLLAKEQQYAIALQFANARFVSALAERKDLIGPVEHKILFQNSDELLRITEEILENLVLDDGDYQTNYLLRVYHSKLFEIIVAYKKYCSGIKKADCVLANLSKNEEFARFLLTPSIPRRRPDLTVFIHKPLEHYREILKLFNVILSNMKSNHEDYPVINHIVHELQVSYREMTSEAGLMEPVGEGRPLLSLQDLENRLVFTKCKPFVLNKPGRQWIFGGDLSRVEGRTTRQYWGLLFNDILMFAKVSRDRVLFILEDPIPLNTISDLFFTCRKKANEFRIIINPGSNKNASSPTVHCGPDLSRTPRKGPAKKCIILRTPTVELKAVWQNLLQRQIFHVNAAMDGSSYSSPLESPEAPITSSVVTLQSTDSLSFRRQTPRNLNYSDKDDKDKTHIDELIEHKCKQLEKSSSGGKSNAIHLEQWMKGQFGSESIIEQDEENLEFWTKEQVNKRSEELHLIDQQGNPICSIENRKDYDDNSSDQDQSPSKSTNTTESQVTVRSSPLVPETVNVCRQCHKNCITNQEVTNKNLDNLDSKNNNEEEEDWRSLMFMGLTALNPAATLLKFDPFAAPVPQISILPPTPELHQKNINQNSCNCNNRPQLEELTLNKDYDNSPDDSPLNDEQPYHSLNSSNLTLRRFGTVSSLEILGSEDREETYDAKGYSSDEEQEEMDEIEDAHQVVGIDNEAYNHSSILKWTSLAGSYVVEKMAFFERLGEDYRTSTKFFEKYLKTEVSINGDEAVQEEETSGATSGEEVWGTPTSGGELDDLLNSPQNDGVGSPNDASISSNEDTELMMDELLMTPPVSGALIRGLLPRRTLEPLMEEDYSDSCTSSTSSPTEPSASPEEGNETGDAADECSSAADGRSTRKSCESLGTPPVEEPHRSNSIHRSESYRMIIEQEDDNVGFFTRFRNRPSMKFVNIERIPPTRGAKFLEFFNVRRERKIYETFPSGRHLVKVFSREGDFSDEVPTAYSDNPEALRKVKERQLDKRFWKQLSRRRGKPVQLVA